MFGSAYLVKWPFDGEGVQAMRVCWPVDEAQWEYIFASNEMLATA